MDCACSASSCISDRRCSASCNLRRQQRRLSPQSTHNASHEVACFLLAATQTSGHPRAHHIGIQHSGHSTLDIADGRNRWEESGPCSQAAALSLQLSADATNGGGHRSVERLCPPLGIRTQRIRLASSRSPLLSLRVCNCRCSLPMAVTSMLRLLELRQLPNDVHTMCLDECAGAGLQVGHAHLRLCLYLLPQLLGQFSGSLRCCPCLLCPLSTALRLQSSQLVAQKGSQWSRLHCSATSTCIDLLATYKQM